MNKSEDNIVDYLVMYIGNWDGRDDAIGSYIADKLDQEKCNFVVLNWGITPEKFTSIVKQHTSKNLVIVDAVEMGFTPGEIRIVSEEKIGAMHISIHGVPISALIDYLKQYVENIFFIGIQLKTMLSNMTDIVKNSGDKLVKTIKNNSLGQVNRIA